MRRVQKCTPCEDRNVDGGNVNVGGDVARQCACRRKE